MENALDLNKEYDVYQSPLILRMKSKLAKLEQQLEDLIRADPALLHGGTPIPDNSKGKKIRKSREKMEEKRQNLRKTIEDYKIKIDKTVYRLIRNNQVTKKSTKFMEKNPIHPKLQEYADKNLLRQWKKNPHIFFVPHLTKVALSTFNGKVGINSRFQPTNKEEWEIALNLCNEINQQNCFN